MPRIYTSTNDPDADHPGYECDDYRCLRCRKRLDETDDKQELKDSPGR